MTSRFGYRSTQPTLILSWMPQAATLAKLPLEPDPRAPGMG
jgi:hypothetical protein